MKYKGYEKNNSLLKKNYEKQRKHQFIRFPNK